MLPLVLRESWAAEHPSALCKWYSLCPPVIFHSVQQWGKGLSFTSHNLVWLQCLFRHFDWFSWIVLDWFLFEGLSGKGLEQKTNFCTFDLIQCVSVVIALSLHVVSAHTWAQSAPPRVTWCLVPIPPLVLSPVYVWCTSVMNHLLTNLCALWICDYKKNFSHFS